MNELSTKAGGTTPSTRNAIYLTDLNFNANLDYNNSNNTKSILISSGAKFSVSDATYSKVYKFNRNGKFRLSSSDGSRDIDSGTSTNIDTLITNINNIRNVTSVVATSLGINSDGDSQFMLTSTKKGIRILENDSVNLFDDISLTSSLLTDTTLAKGAVSSAHSVNNILDVDISFNRGAIDGIGDWGGNKLIHFNNNNIIDVGTLQTTLGSVGELSFDGNLDLQTDTIFTLSAGERLTVAGDFIVPDTLIIRGNLIVGGDMIVEGSILTLGVGSLIVQGSATIKNAGENYFIEANTNTYIRGSLTGGIRNIASLRHIVSNLPSSIAQKQGIGYLDTNISQVPVGLFSLKGQPFPSLAPDLKSNPSPSLGFPISGGIIESMYEGGKKMNTIITMQYSSSNQGFWRTTDLTKNIDTLYGNSYDSDDDYNNDDQGIFHLHPNKAYWVNVSDITNTTRIKYIQDALVLEDSKVTMQSYTHFSNTFNKGISTTQNHINHRLNIKFKEDNSFISSSDEGADYYNVVAIIKGQRYYLKRNGAYFSLDINDNDMPLKEKTIKEKDESIILEAYDGTGLAIKENNKNNSHFKIKYFKPSIPTLTWDETNDLILDEVNKADIDNNISTLEIYTTLISDISSQRKKFLLSDNNVSINKDNNKLLNWNYSNDEDLYGGLVVLKATIKKKDESKRVSFYSDTRALLYAPLKKGHILEANTTNKIDILPYSYISNKKLTKDNGVQLNYLNANSHITRISMAYYPQGSKEGLISLQGTSFGASRSMFLRVDTGLSNQDAIGIIKYLPEYIGKIFYINFNNKLYQGRFVNDDRYSSDDNAYNLESEVIGIDGFSRGNDSQADENGGRFVKSEQGI